MRERLLESKQKGEEREGKKETRRKGERAEEREGGRKGPHEEKVDEPLSSKTGPGTPDSVTSSPQEVGIFKVIDAVEVCLLGLLFFPEDQRTAFDQRSVLWGVGGWHWSVSLPLAVFSLVSPLS